MDITGRQNGRWSLAVGIAAIGISMALPSSKVIAQNQLSCDQINATINDLAQKQMQAYQNYSNIQQHWYDYLAQGHTTEEMSRDRQSWLDQYNSYTPYIQSWQKYAGDNQCPGSIQGQIPASQQTPAPPPTRRPNAPVVQNNPTGDPPPDQNNPPPTSNNPPAQPANPPAQTGTQAGHGCSSGQGQGNNVSLLGVCPPPAPPRPTWRNPDNTPNSSGGVISAPAPSDQGGDQGGGGSGGGDPGGGGGE